jgi:hypothetical protein
VLAREILLKLNFCKCQSLSPRDQAKGYKVLQIRLCCEKNNLEIFFPFHNFLMMNWCVFVKSSTLETGCFYDVSESARQNKRHSDDNDNTSAQHTIINKGGYHNVATTCDRLRQ